MPYFYSVLFSRRNEVEGNKKERDEIETFLIFSLRGKIGRKREVIFM